MSSKDARRDVAAALVLSVGVLVRGLRQARPTSEDELTMPETTALARLDRGGPRTAASLARIEQISAQSLGATLQRLHARGLIMRTPDPDDGRQMVLSVTAAGREVLRTRRTARVALVTQALKTGQFTDAELADLRTAAPLIERLAESL